MRPPYRAIFLLLAPAVVADDDAAAAARRTFAAPRVAVAMRVEREFAMPFLVFLRGRYEEGRLRGGLSSAMKPGARETLPQDVRLEAARWERDDGAGFAAFDPGWLRPSCGLAAHLPALLEGLAAGGPSGTLRGPGLLDLLKPLGPAFELVHALDRIDPGAAWCRYALEIEGGEVRSFRMRLQLGAAHFYRLTGTLRAGAAKTPDPGGWAAELDAAPPPPEIRLGDLPETPPERVREAIARGVRFLGNAQKPDGSFVSDQAEQVPYPSQRVAITAVALHALAACGARDEGARGPLRRGVAALERMAKERVLEESRAAHGTFDFSPWGAAFGLVHGDGLLRAWPGGKAPDLGALARSWVAFAWSKQKPCGGWHYRVDAADGSVTILTAAMAEGLRAWKARGLAVEPDRLARALDDLRRNRDAKGAYGYYHGGAYESAKGSAWSTPESAGRSVQAALVLVDLGVEEPAALAAALRRFVEEYRHFLAQRKVYAHSPPYMIAGYYYHFGIHFAARGVARAELPEKERATIRRLLLHELVRHQEEDGSWEDSPAGGKPYATAMALLSLKALE